MPSCNMSAGCSHAIVRRCRVTEKNNDTQHNFMTDPIRLIRAGDWLKARLSAKMYGNSRPRKKTPIRYALTKACALQKPVLDQIAFLL